MANTIALKVSLRQPFDRVFPEDILGKAILQIAGRKTFKKTDVEILESAGVEFVEVGKTQ